MAVTQYIGARYVPLFADPIEWSSTESYEPLTIVTHEGNSYTSRQFVPVGIDILNESFWALTGNYDAQVEQYRQETARYREDVNEAMTMMGQKVFWFDTVADMAASTQLYVGATCSTKGYHAIGDGGDATYYVDGTGTANGIDIIQCGNLIAHLLVGDVLYLEQLGAVTNIDNTAIINRALLLGTTIGTRAVLSLGVGSPLVMTRDGQTLDLAGSTMYLTNPLQTLPLLTVSADNVTIRNGYLRGGWDGTEPSNEHSHCIALKSASHVVIEDMHLSNARGDGIYIGGEGRSTDVFVQNCLVNHCYRCPIALINTENVHIDNCMGMDCNSCIDLEPNQSTETLYNIHITNYTAIRCSSAVGVAYSYNQADNTIYLDNIVSVNCSGATIAYRNTGGTSIVGCVMDVGRVTAVNQSAPIVSLRYVGTGQKNVFSELYAYGCAFDAPIEAIVDTNNVIPLGPMRVYLHNSTYDYVAKAVHTNNNGTINLDIETNSTSMTVSKGSGDTVKVCNPFIHNTQALVPSSMTLTIDGGYTVYGNLVVVCFRIVNTTEAIPTTESFALPRPAGNNVSVETNIDGVRFGVVRVGTAGQANFTAQIPSGSNVFVNCVYVTDRWGMN